jgi:serine/threonine protein kinase
MSATASTSPAVGSLVDGRYQLVSMLGEGTFGGVWRAKDTRLAGRPVAVKFLKAEFVEHAGAIARFDAEADALAQVSHPNIVGVIDRGALTQQRYIVMEFVEGRALSAWILQHRESGKIPDLHETLAIFDQLCAGIEAAHAVRTPGPIVHRDLKPDNVILRVLPNGEVSVKVLDFGIAQLGRRKGTQTGALMGTPLYMAPEQAMGQVAAIGPWTDVFALGVLLVEMLTTDGQATIDEPWWGAALQRPTTLRASLDNRRADVPPALWDVVARCFRAQGAERFADAGALRTAVRQSVAGVVSASAPSSPPWASSTPPATSAAVRSPTPVLTPEPRDAPPLPHSSFNWLSALSAKPAGATTSSVGRSDAAVEHDDPPWGRLAVVVVVGAVAAALAIVALLVGLDGRRHDASAGATNATSARPPRAPAPPPRPITTQSLPQNAELSAFVTRWERAHRAEPGADSLDRLYATTLKYHGTSRTPDFNAMSRELARVTAEGGTFTVDRARSDWGREEPDADAVPSACRSVPDASGPVLKVRAWAVEVRSDRNADIGCPRLEGRYLLRMRETPAGLRICHETWSVDEGICASCPTAPLCQRRRD